MGSSTGMDELAVMGQLAQEVRMAPNRSLSQVIYASLRRSILRGEIPSGRRLVEERLASLLGASRTPVREALQRLTQEDLLQKLRYGGYEVRRITTKEVEEIFGIRSVLESYAAVLATRNMDQEVMEELERIIRISQEALDSHDLESFVRLNTDFHDRLYRASKSDRLYRTIQELRDHFYRFRRIILSKGRMPSISIKDHRAMIKAMQRRDEKKVERLVRQHILRGMKVVLREMKRGGISS